MIIYEDDKIMLSVQYNHTTKTLENQFINKVQGSLASHSKMMQRLTGAQFTQIITAIYELGGPEW